MSGVELDISGSLAWEDGLPRPQWDLIEELVESRCERDARRTAWIAVVLQWLAELGPALGGGYETVESDHFLVLAPEVDATGRPVLRIAERCRVALLSVLGGVANFEGHGKSVVLVLRTRDDYYRYISLYFPEGEHGGSAGLHVRDGYPHVALYGREPWMVEPTVAHELTHVSLYHLSMPQWLEEGLAQMFEHDVTGSSPLEVDAEMARRQKRYWGRCGLDVFWRGEAFSRRGKVQELSYQLAEILVRLLVEEGRPRWFGRVREPQRRLLAFLREAGVSDGGEAACREHLGVALSDLAARFLGPGPWSPGPGLGLA
jgi:hypothetical protein